MDVRFRPLPAWPHETTPAYRRRGRSTFKASWQSTLNLIERELEHLKARDVIIGVAMRESDIRIDGWPRSNAKAPSHPGVEISFTAAHGRLVYATDVCDFWEHNVRSIALGLGDLRAVDLHIGSQRGSQYAGFRELESSTAAQVRRGLELIEAAGGEAAARRSAHPDHGGSQEDFVAVQAAIEARR